MVKVLFIIWSLERGGAERFLAGLLHHLDRQKFEPVLCCLNWKGEWAAPLEEKGIRVIALNKKNGLDLKAYAALVQIIREGKFHVVNTHLWAADVMGRVAAFKCRVPVVISTAQNVDIWKRWWHRWTDRLLSIKTDKLIAVSKAVKGYYHQTVGIPNRKIEVIPNAIDVPKYEAVGDFSYLYKEFDVSEKDFILACVGRLNVQKGHPYLFESLKQLKTILPDLKVLIVGEGEDKEELLALADEKDVKHMVRFVGQRQDIPQILKCSNGLILPSIFEGLPLCVLEAMAASRPVIATDVGGTKELAVDQETAFIVPPKDSDALQEAIQKLYALDDRGVQMGIRGHEIVTNHFSIQSITQKTGDLFESLLEGKL